MANLNPFASRQLDELLKRKNKVLHDFAERGRHHNNQFDFEQKGPVLATKKRKPDNVVVYPDGKYLKTYRGPVKHIATQEEDVLNQIKNATKLALHQQQADVPPPPSFQHQIDMATKVAQAAKHAFETPVTTEFQQQIDTATKIALDQQHKAVPSPPPLNAYELGIAQADNPDEHVDTSMPSTQMLVLAGIAAAALLLIMKK